MTACRSHTVVRQFAKDTARDSTPVHVEKSIARTRVTRLACSEEQSGDMGREET